MADRDGTPDAARSSDGREGTDRRREVVVPEHVYRVVTVFSTLLAIVGVVAGFAVLDAATTLVENPPGSLVVQVLAALGVPMATLTANRSLLALGVGLAGLALVAGGAAVYVYGTRFRAERMGKPKADAEEPSDDG